MGFRFVVLLSFCYISVLLKATNAANFYDITSYGAKGDGQTDDVNAFVQAWTDICKDTTNPTLIIPSGRTFLTSCLSFSGPCSSKRVYIRLLGDITAPKSIKGWHGCNANGQLIIFQYIKGLTIDGPGKFDGQGALWWPKHTPQGFLMIFVLSLCYILFGPRTASAANFDITSYGAKGDGNTDDSKALLNAWADLCKDNSPNPTLIVPSGKTFLISPVGFIGPCNSPRVNIKLLGNISAPKTLAGWKDCISNDIWIHFRSVNGLTIDGPGQIDGHGSLWWGKGKALTQTCNLPTALHFHDCKALRLRGTTHINIPMLHISINACQDVDIGNVRILAPGDSPNTDGIDIGRSSRVNIHNSNIQTGDDCIAINGGVYDVNVSAVFCGPGHGISIGSLGENGGYDTVENILVENCNITGTTNGLRIKTVPYGRGYAKGIVFRNIQLINVKNPIIIDQHYCNSKHGACSSPPSAPGVQVSGVIYENIYGSSATEQAITLNCSEKHKCNGIQTNSIGITGENVFAVCKSVEGVFADTTPPVRCN